MAPRVPSAAAAMSSSEACATPLSWNTCSAASRMRVRVIWDSSLVRLAIPVDIHSRMYVNCRRFRQACKDPTNNKDQSMRSQARIALRVAVAASLAATLAACGPKGPPGGGHGGMPPALVAGQAVQPKTVAVELEYPAATPGPREGEGGSRAQGI